MAHDVDGVVMPVSGKYSCLNPKCPMVIASAQKAAEADAKGNGKAVISTGVTCQPSCLTARAAYRSIQWMKCTVSARLYQFDNSSKAVEQAVEQAAKLRGTSLTIDLRRGVDYGCQRHPTVGVALLGSNVSDRLSLSSEEILVSVIILPVYLFKE